MIIGPWEQTLLEGIQSDGKSISSIGISIDTDGNGIGDTPYCTDLPMPVKNFLDRVPPGSKIDKQVSDGLRMAAAPLVRQMAPFTFHNSATTFGGITVASGSPTTLLSVVSLTSTQLQAARKAMVTANFTCFANAINQKLSYWITVNGVQSDTFQFFFNATSTHTSVGGNWTITIPSGPLTLNLVGQNTGASTISFDTNDFISVSVIG